jgi:hypothetical protein
MNTNGNEDGLFLDEICISPAVWTGLWPSSTGRPGDVPTAIDPSGPGEQMRTLFFSRAKAARLPLVAPDHADREASARRVGEEIDR